MVRVFPSFSRGWSEMRLPFRYWRTETFLPEAAFFASSERSISVARVAGRVSSESPFFVMEDVSGATVKMGL